MKKEDTETSIIVISYNTRTLTIDCLRSIFTSIRSSAYEIIVLDNDSADGSYEAIRAHYNSQLMALHSQENLGFAQGNNVAAQHAAGRYLLLLNPDTVVLPGATDNLLLFAKEFPEAGIWGGRTLFPDGSHNPSSCWMRQTLWSLISQALGLSSLMNKSTFFNPEGIGGWNRDGTREVDIVSGCFFLITSELWKILGGFHPDFFMYGEEADLCLRAKKLGAQPMVTAAATIIHYGGASEKARADKLVRLIKAKMLLIKRHFPWYSRGLGFFLLTMWPFSRYLAHTILVYLGRKNSQENRDNWRRVWNLRREWQIG